MPTEQINKPSDLPNSKIIAALIAKGNAKEDRSFDYISYLNYIRKRISIEVSRINVLFPDYTPHDEKYHLKRLFGIADELLGDDLIDSMNVTELFLLAISLYAHDWGMAVSEQEKETIIHHEAPDADCCLLDHENDQICAFCRTKNVAVEDIGLEEWREYVRLTHAFRSGRRIKAYFDPINSGIADFACRICEGHWLNFNIIEDHTSYPTNASINGDVVNVKALTIYVRLVDLLDLSEDRTPYVLWKFVAPRNAFSRMEWAKHRCLQPVTFPGYQNGRYIQVEGSTDDHNVYMSIMDLKRYVDDQFRQSSDILHRMHHDYHKLDISHLSWRIAPRGFEPVMIQFEFDRNRMFDILGDDIYRGNPYVFLRELVQNAIDAIQMRTEMLEKKDLSFKPKITVKVTEEEECYVIQVTDNGIGMDEYVIKNYLAVAGKSYYRSSDFQKEGLKMDSISRFGIGVLSCFMVADYIEIDTYKDPNTTARQEQFKVCIPAKENYFKISKTTGDTDVGTTFKVYVLKKKLVQEGETPKEFQVTEYLKQTVAFVRYPIYVTENGVETIICGPDVEVTSDKDHICRLDYAYPIEKVIPPQYVDVVKEYFVEKRYHLKKDLKLADYDGCITYLLPKSETMDLIALDRSLKISGAKIIDYFNSSFVQRNIKWNEESVSFQKSNILNNKKNTPDRTYKAYMNGILLSNISCPIVSLNKNDDIDYFSEIFAGPQLYVNISKGSDMKINLARTNISSKERWDALIWRAFFKYLQENEIKNYLTQVLDIRLLSFAKLITFFKLSVEVVIKELINPSYFPLLFITSDGDFIFYEFNSIKFQFIQQIPALVGKESTCFFESHYIKNKKYKRILEKWRGKEVFAKLEGEFDITNCTLNAMPKLMNAFIDFHYYLYDIQFVSSSLGDDQPLVSEILKLKSLKEEKMEYQKISTFDIDNIDEFHLYKLNFCLRDHFSHFPTIIKFPKPYDNKLFYRFDYLNFNNQFTKRLLKICIAIVLEEDLSKEVKEQLLDLLNDLPFMHEYFGNSNINLTSFNEKINVLFHESFSCGLLQKRELLKRNIELNDFVPCYQLARKQTDTFQFGSAYEYLLGDQEWGLPITK